ncbi:hypothetical protein Ac2012v2_007276 [Leucoagaricus gongylophorus]
MDLDSFRLFYLHLTSLPTLLAISRMWIHRVLLGLLQLFLVAKCTPPGFPSSGNGLWYKEPGMIWSRDWLPVGNGYLAVTTPGGTNYEATQLNIESLWSGGPLPSFASFVDILVGHVKDYQDRLLPESAVGYFSG